MHKMEKNKHIILIYAVTDVENNIIPKSLSGIYTFYATDELPVFREIIKTTGPDVIVADCALLSRTTSNLADDNEIFSQIPLILINYDNGETPSALKSLAFAAFENIPTEITWQSILRSAAKCKHASFSGKPESEQESLFMEELRVSNEELRVANEQLIQEIMNRNKIEAKLRDSELKLKAFFEQSVDGISLLDEKGNILEWNPAMETMTGLKAGEVTGEKIWDIEFKVAPREKQTIAFQEKIRASSLAYLNELDTAKPIYVESTSAYSMGKTKYAQLSIFPILTSQNKFVGRILRDITRRREAEDELKRHKKELENEVKARTRQLSQSEEKFRIIFKHTPGFVILSNLDTRRIEDANNSFLDKFGLKKDYIIGKTLLELELIEKKQFHGENQLINEKSNYSDFNLTLKDKEEEPVYCLSAGEIVHINDKECVVQMLNDITRLKKNEFSLKELNEEMTAAEEELRTTNDELILTNEKLEEAIEKLKVSERNYREIFNATSDAIFINDAETFAILDVNRAAEEMFGIKKSSFLNLTADDLTSDKRFFPREKAHEYMQKSKEEGTQVYEWHAKRIDGTSFWIEVSIRHANIGGKSRILSLVRNIDQRKKQDKVIRQAAEIFDNIQTGMHIYHLENPEDDSTLRMVGANPATALLTGVNPEEIIGKTLDENFPGLREKGVPQLYAKVIRENKAIAIEDITYGDNRVISGAFSVKAFPLPDNKVCVAFDNITDKKKAEDDLIRSETKFRTIFNSTYELIGILDKEGRIKDLNNTSLKYLNSNMGEMSGRYFCENNFFNHSEKEKDKIKKAVQEAARGKSNRFNVSHQLPSGEIRIIDFTILPVYDKNGEITFLLPEGRDITEEIAARNREKEQLEFLNTLLETIPIPVFYKDKEGKYIGCNTVFEKYTGYKREDIIGKSVFEITSKELGNVYKNKDEELLDKGTTQVYESEMKYADGTNRNIIFHKAIYNDSTGNKQGIIGAMFDITDKKRMQRKLIETVIETEEKERQRLAEDLHDEIGPILSSMKMYIGAISSTTGQEKREYIISQVVALVKDAISTVREISTALSPHILKNYGIVEAVKNALERIDPFLQTSFKQNIGNTRFSQNIEIVFYRIIKELINNTIKHANATSILVDLTLAEDTLNLEYLDDGKGFDFEKELTESKHGMGLYNIHNRVKMINGEYQVFSQPGKGFKLNLGVKLETT